MLIRAKEEIQLVSEICRLTAEVGGYKMSWVGYAEDDATHSINLFAHFGNFSHILKYQIILVSRNSYRKVANWKNNIQWQTFVS